MRTCYDSISLRIHFDVIAMRCKHFVFKVFCRLLEIGIERSEGAKYWFCYILLSQIKRIYHILLSHNSNLSGIYCICVAKILGRRFIIEKTPTYCIDNPFDHASFHYHQYYKPICRAIIASTYRSFVLKTEYLYFESEHLEVHNLCMSPKSDVEANKKLNSGSPASI